MLKLKLFLQKGKQKKNRKIIHLKNNHQEKKYSRHTRFRFRYNSTNQSTFNVW